ncbi:MAG: TOBE domain-containing protein [Anaerolineae bacterium]
MKRLFIALPLLVILGLIAAQCGPAPTPETVTVVETVVVEKVADRVRRGNGADVWLGIRAENIETLTAPAEGALPARVLVVEPLGSHNLLTVQVGDELLKVNTRADAAFEPGQDVWLRLLPDKIRWLDKTTGQALN